MTPAAGIYYDVPYSEYASWDALRSTDLKALLKAPLYMREREDVDKPHFALGRAVHALAFERDTYKAEFVVAPKCRVTLKSGARKGEPCGAQAIGRNADGGWACGNHGGKPENESRTILTLHLGKTVEMMSRRWMSHKGVRELLGDDRAKGEVSIVWEEGGVLCKCRLDYWNAHTGVILDLKTTAKKFLDEQGTRYIIQDFGYHISAAWYLRGCQAINKPYHHAHDFKYLFQQTHTPYDIYLCELEGAAIDVGWNECNRGLELYAKCKDSNSWPGVQADGECGITGLPHYEQEDIDAAAAKRLPKVSAEELGL